MPKKKGPSDDDIQRFAQLFYRVLLWKQQATKGMQVRRQEIINIMVNMMKKQKGPFKEIFGNTLDYLDRTSAKTQQFLELKNLSGLQRSISQQLTNMGLQEARDKERLEQAGKSLLRGGVITKEKNRVFSYQGIWLLFPGVSGESMKTPTQASPSSNVVMVLYDEKKKDLHVVFCGEHQSKKIGNPLTAPPGAAKKKLKYVAPRYYIYHKVDKTSFDKLVKNTDSAGEFFWNNFVRSSRGSMTTVWGPYGSKKKMKKRPRQSYHELMSSKKGIAIYMKQSKWPDRTVMSLLPDQTIN